jgi:hypothetical protein
MKQIGQLSLLRYDLDIAEIEGRPIVLIRLSRIARPEYPVFGDG